MVWRGSSPAIPLYMLTSYACTRNILITPFDASKMTRNIQLWSTLKCLMCVDLLIMPSPQYRSLRMDLKAVSITYE